MRAFSGGLYQLLVPALFKSCPSIDTKYGEKADDEHERVDKEPADADQPRTEQNGNQRHDQGRYPA